MGSTCHLAKSWFRKAQALQGRAVGTGCCPRERHSGLARVSGLQCCTDYRMRTRVGSSGPGTGKARVQHWISTFTKQTAYKRGVGPLDFLLLFNLVWDKGGGQSILFWFPFLSLQGRLGGGGSRPVHALGLVCFPL